MSPCVESGTKGPSESGEHVSPGSEKLRVLKAEISRFAEKSEEHGERIRMLLRELPETSINNIIYEIFAPHYDEFMKVHEIALSRLVRMLFSAENAGLLGGRVSQDTIFRDGLMELSCGTGTVLKLIIESLSEERLLRHRITANDLSDDMRALAAIKLEGLPCRIEYSTQDMRTLEVAAGSYGTIILSQTLHLIHDPKVVEEERSKGYLHVSADRHTPMKFEVIRRAFEALEAGGYFVLLDEWPALLSKGRGALGPGFAYLFNDGLRPIDLDMFQQSVMGQIPDANFVIRLNVPIDSEHSMHAIVYRKSPGWRSLPLLPARDEFAHYRKDAVSRAISTLMAVEGDFIEGVAPALGDNGFVRPIPMDGADTFISVTGDGVSVPEGRECVILPMRMHNMSGSNRRALMANAVSSLKVGGSLVVIEQWPAPRNSTNPMKMRDLRRIYSNTFSHQLLPVGSLRLPLREGYTNGMYAFKCIKVSD